MNDWEIKPVPYFPQSTYHLSILSNQLVPLFVMDILGDYPGVPGIFVSCIISGSLSSLSSGKLVGLCRSVSERVSVWVSEWDGEQVCEWVPEMVSEWVDGYEWKGWMGWVGWVG